MKCVQGPQPKNLQFEGHGDILFVTFSYAHSASILVSGCQSKYQIASDRDPRKCDKCVNSAFRTMTLVLCNLHMSKVMFIVCYVYLIQ